MLAAEGWRMARLMREVSALLVGPNVGKESNPPRDAIFRNKSGLVVQTLRRPSLGVDRFVDVDAVVLEYVAGMEPILELLPRLRQSTPHVIVILVNGGLTQMQKAIAFYTGAADYFPLPGKEWQWEALADRIVSLVQKQGGQLDQLQRDKSRADSVC